MHGNLIEKAGPGGVTTYDYDYENRLIEVVTPDHEVVFEYDHDGNRIAKDVDGYRVEYVVDIAQPYPDLARFLWTQDLGAIMAPGGHRVQKTKT